MSSSKNQFPRTKALPTANFQTQFKAFFDALDAGKDMPLTSFADGFATHRIIAAADRSAAEGKAVRVEGME